MSRSLVERKETLKLKHTKERKSGSCQSSYFNGVFGEEIQAASVIFHALNFLASPVVFFVVFLFFFSIQP
jgi:hypothetical protein